jgi:transcriptional regulator with XRE-family HTH domain
MSLGRRIYEIRQAKELTQAQISKKTGLAVSYLSRIENDHLEPAFSTLQKIADALEVNLVDFFGYEEQKKFQDQCPISLSGQCIAEHIYAAGRKRLKIDAERYSTKQVRLLQLANYLVLFGDKKLHDLLELLFISLIKSPSVKKDREWLDKLGVSLGGRS